MNKESHAIKN